jgi:eukaryotic-like serine/threonine-protein kinase
MSYEIGSRVGEYEILQILGAGGMGRVYKVRNVISDRIEAMKVLLPDLEGNPGLADRFMREIKVQASLDHPNIAALYTALRVENQLLMLMEYVEGTTLDKLMESGPVPIEKGVDCIVQVLAALSYAHARGVVHRDLKPANMMVTPGGIVKLMDFGIAKMAADRKLTQTGSTVGSLYYMSPEQIKGATDIDARSDLYSLGVSLYEVVTGARPFQGDSEYSIMAAHLQGNPPPPVQISPNLPAGLSEIILQALEKDPSKRFQTADAFRNALLFVCRPAQATASAPATGPAPLFATQPQIPPPPPAFTAQPQVPPAPQSARSHRGLWIAVGALLGIAVLAVVAMQIPKFRHTAAQTESAQTGTENSAVQAPAPETAQTAAPKPAPTEASNEVTSAPVTALQQNQPQAAAAQPGQSTPVQQTSANFAAPQSSRAASSPKPAVKNLQSPEVKSSPSGRISAESSQPAASQPAPAPAAPAAAASTPPASEDKTAEQLKEIRKDLDLLGMRAATVRGSLDSLRKQQAASGLGLRSDMANAAQRMDYYLSQAETSLNRRDAEGAKKNLDLAENEVSKLENFLHK